MQQKHTIVKWSIRVSTPTTSFNTYQLMLKCYILHVLWDSRCPSVVFYCDRRCCGVLGRPPGREAGMAVYIWPGTQSLSLCGEDTAGLAVDSRLQDFWVQLTTAEFCSYCLVMQHYSIVLATIQTRMHSSSAGHTAEFCSSADGHTAWSCSGVLLNSPGDHTDKDAL